MSSDLENLKQLKPYEKCYEFRERCEFLTANP